MQPRSNSYANQPRAATATEQLAARAREIQQLCEQLATASVKEGPSLVPLNILEINKAWECAQLTQSMRLILSSLKAYVPVCASEVRKIPSPVKFKG